jgi:hypothetical protein
MPPSYRVDELRPPLLKNGKALPRWAVERLDVLLRVSPLDLPEPGLDEARAACEPRSLAEHAWDLAKAWDIDGAKDSQRWMLHAVAHLGDDEVVRRLTPALKGAGIAGMLGHIGTDAALMELVTILVRISRRTAKTRPKYAYGTEKAIALIAARRGLDVDELEDRFVPTCDVDETGGITLDLGSRAYRVGFDHRLALVLTDEKGERVRGLPRSAKEDDPSKIEAAAVLLEDLEEDLGAIAELRAASLERAMLDGRTWSREAFDAVWARHPIASHMARAVLWEGRAADGRRLLAFRVAEDGTFADAMDERVALPDEATHVGVAHAVRLSESDRVRWRGVFEDYELLQPLEQLAREPAALSADELEATSVTRRRKADMKELLGRLSKIGYETSGTWAVAPFEDGVFGALRLSGDTAIIRASRDGHPLRFGDLDPVARTELVRALEMAAGER